MYSDDHCVDVVKMMMMKWCLCDWWLWSSNRWCWWYEDVVDVDGDFNEDD